MKQKVIKGYKTVTADLKSGHGDLVWTVGEWKKHEGELKLCECGFHASKHPYDVALEFCQGPRVFEVEARGTIVHSDNNAKFVASEMRLVREVVTVEQFNPLCVRFGVWNARNVLPIFEKSYPKDDRPRKAIEAAEAWIKAYSAADSAAYSAARSAADSAADSAASAASAAYSAADSAAYLAASAAYSAAYSAADSAADSAARSAAYSAADSAARSAASAAYSAASAAYSAACSAARKKFKELVVACAKEKRR